MTIDLTQFYQAFFEESKEHLAAMETLLLGLDVDDPDTEDLNAIFRAAHSIKGSAGTFGFNDMAELTHVLESLLDRIRKRQLLLRADMVDVFLEAGDVLKTMLAGHQGQGQVDAEAAAAISSRLHRLSDGDEPNPSPATAPGPARCFDIQFVPNQVSARGEGVANFVADIRRLGEVDILAQPEGAADGVGFWQIRLTTTAGSDTFADRLDFIADSGAWRVSEIAAPTSDGGADFGFFDDAPGVPDDERGYGFFDAPDAKPADDDGYGFFEPLPVPAPPETVPAAAVDLDSPRAEIREAAVKVPKTAGSNGDSSIRVGVEKVDQLINLVGELVITQAMLLQTAALMQADAPESLLTGLAQLERNTRDLQEAAMSIRMLPISFVFSRFPRLVRDLSAKLGKQVELKTFGESTELDKGLIERIADPLTHLIRNSLDHGIEKPEKRAAAGKGPVGSIILKAYHQGGNIVIEVGDDGAGLDRQKILAKARERGLAVGEQMSDQEVFGLIFEAGFSTAEQVTDISGRGVGMDVVRRNIQALGGRVEIESMVGIGTRITVRLPLTLAILDGMSVAVGDQTYILPLSAVVESVQPRAADIRTLSGQARVVQVRGEYLPVLVLGEVFNLASRWQDFTQGIMVVIDADGSRAALFVDELLGQHQVVVKSLEANYRRVLGVSGATIMGDGRVALILDVAAIAGLARTHMHKAA